MKSICRLGWVMVVVLVLAASAAAKQGYGTISGVVLDPSGRPHHRANPFQSEWCVLHGSPQTGRICRARFRGGILAGDGAPRRGDVESDDASARASGNHILFAGYAAREVRCSRRTGRLEVGAAFFDGDSHYPAVG